MPDQGPDWADTARRMRAAIAWAGSSKDFGRAGAAKAMGVETGMVDRMLGTKPGFEKMPTWEQRWALARAVGLPEEWFSADLSRLHEIVPAGLPTIRRSADDAPAPPPAELLQPPAAAAPKPGSAPDAGSGRAADSRQARARS